jgi:hypothetical protein
MTSYGRCIDWLMINHPRHHTHVQALEGKKGAVGAAAANGAAMATSDGEGSAGKKKKKKDKKKEVRVKRGDEEGGKRPVVFVLFTCDPWIETPFSLLAPPTPFANWNPRRRTARRSGRRRRSRAAAPPPRRPRRRRRRARRARRASRAERLDGALEGQGQGGVCLLCW